MQQMLRLVIAAFLAAAFMHFAGVATAQSAVKQIKLTDKQIEGFIAAQKDMSAIAEKMQGGSADKPDPKVQAELESIAKKHGFDTFAEYDDVAANISMVMAGIDPQSKAFTEPKVAIEKEIEEVKNDKSIPEKEKKQMLEELGEALKSAQPIANPGNIELVKKYYDKIDAVLQ
jgi:soluble cytochrome b562